MTVNDTPYIETLPDGYFNGPVYNSETGVFEYLVRDYDSNEVVIMDTNCEDELDRVHAEDFWPERYHQIPEVVIGDPVGYINSHLDDEDDPLGIVGEFKQDISLKYARKQTEIVLDTFETEE